MALKAKKISNIVVIQNKIDLVDMVQAKKNHDEVKQLLGKEYSHAPIIPVSALQQVNIDEIWKALAELPIPKRELDASPIFIVARSFDINKPGTTPDKLHGTVLGGTLKKGQLKVGDMIEIKPGRKLKDERGIKFIPIKTKVISLFRGSKKFDVLTPGGSASIETELDMALGKGDLLSGNLASTLDSLPAATTDLKVHYAIFPEVSGTAGHVKVEPIKPSEMLMLSVNASITGGTANQIKGNEMHVNLKVPLIAFKNDNIGIARNIAGHWRLIGFGEVL
jgi:translation initiation factor 2 subunit 3